ncbi:unnamed protein product [Amoebophrya sp. A120]|nr:unnamed protein product [Amoebophrya sp. A120]|eukprot:GSA120T00017416001.1
MVAALVVDVPRGDVADVARSCEERRHGTSKASDGDIKSSSWSGLNKVQSGQEREVTPAAAENQGGSSCLSYFMGLVSSCGSYLVAFFAGLLLAVHRGIGANLAAAYDSAPFANMMNMTVALALLLLAVLVRECVLVRDGVKGTLFGPRLAKPPSVSEPGAASRTKGSTIPTPNNPAGGPIVPDNIAAQKDKGAGHRRSLPAATKQVAEHAALEVDLDFLSVNDSVGSRHTTISTSVSGNQFPAVEQACFSHLATSKDCTQHTRGLHKSLEDGAAGGYGEEDTNALTSDSPWPTSACGSLRDKQLDTTARSRAAEEVAVTVEQTSSTEDARPDGAQITTQDEETSANELTPPRPFTWDFLKEHYWKFTGGAYGTFIVTQNFLGAEHIGFVAQVLTLFVGQMLGSMVCDHIGFANAAKRRLNAYKCGAVAVATAGVIVVVVESQSSDETASGGPGTSTTASSTTSSAANHRTTFVEDELPFMVLSFLGGIALPMQGSINAAAQKLFSHNPFAGAISSFTGASVLSILLWVVASWDALFREEPGYFFEQPTGRLRPEFWMFTSGCIGGFVVFCVVALGPKLGQTTMWILIAFGQLLGGVFIDQFGLMGFPARKVSPLRWVGIAVVLLGVLLNTQES